MTCLQGWLRCEAEVGRFNAIFLNYASSGFNALIALLMLGLALAFGGPAAGSLAHTYTSGADVPVSAAMDLSGALASKTVVR